MSANHFQAGETRAFRREPWPPNRQLCNSQALGSSLEKLRVQLARACNLSSGLCRCACRCGGLHLGNARMQWGLCSAGCYGLGATNAARAFASLQHPSAGLRLHLEPTQPLLKIPSAAAKTKMTSEPVSNVSLLQLRSLLPPADTTALLCRDAVPELSYLL